MSLHQLTCGPDEALVLWWLTGEARAHKGHLQGQQHTTAQRSSTTAQPAHVPCPHAQCWPLPPWQCVSSSHHGHALDQWSSTWHINQHHIMPKTKNASAAEAIAGARTTALRTDKAQQACHAASFLSRLPAPVVGRQISAGCTGRPNILPCPFSHLSLMCIVTARTLP
jgi:hypothetical protein